MTFWKDTGNKAEKYYKKVMKKYFPELIEAEFIFTFRNNEKFDDDGKSIVAEAKKIGARERDLYGPDFEINMHADTWASAREEDKYRIAYHELKHCRVETDEEGELKRDDTGRLVTKLEAHDLYMKSFKDEVELFGLSADYLETAEFLKEVLEGASASKKRKKFMDDLDKIPEKYKKGKKKKKLVDEDEPKEKIKVKKKDLDEAAADLKSYKVTRKNKGKEKSKKKKSKLTDD